MILTNIEKVHFCWFDYYRSDAKNENIFQKLTQSKEDGIL